MQVVNSARAVTTKLFRGLSDHSRLTILETLSSGPLTVGQIVERTGLSQPNVSNHLCCLKGCGLVSSMQQGRYISYRQSNGSVAKLLAIADELTSQCAYEIESCNNYSGKDIQ